MVDVSPTKQNVDHLFSNTTYYIDFYQRDYKWTDGQVQRLIDDIFYGFEEAYKENKNLDPKRENIVEKYPWYYLNTYVTNTVEGRVYVVDGQQRLTTLTLMLIHLYHMAETKGSKLKGWISGKIAGQDGYDSRFWMNHERHLDALKALFGDNDEVPTDSGITASNMLDNYNLIAEEFDDRLADDHKFETFVFYFLHRLVLINLSVEQTDVPMVFEVINDRGLRLRPYEILKGKLLGQIDKIELDSGGFNELWEAQVSKVNDFRSEEIDAFFVYLLKAKYSDTRALGQRFDSDYHREMFKKDMDVKLELEHNATRVKFFLKNDFRYYTNLYCRMWQLANSETVGYEHAYYNRLNEMDTQFQLVLAACRVDDPEEDQKIQLIVRNLDRLSTLLRLQRAYSSNDFTDRIFVIAREIRDADAEIITSVFDEAIIDELKKRREIDAATPFEYAHFKNTTYTDLGQRFTRYLFARVDSFIAKNTKSGEKFPIDDLVTKTGRVNGFHIEHIISHNDENVALYDDDVERFDSDRNRLGGVLLLKGRDNISSGNETFQQKLKTYANTLHWNETLRKDSYKSKKDFSDFIARTGLKFEPLDVFGPEELESRHRLLFEIASQIWAADEIERD